MRGWLKKLLGNRGERHAAKFLRRKGYKILAKQFSNRFGEIDIIAQDGDSLVFVEVKTRRSTVAGQPYEAVDSRKQRQMTRVALAFLKRRGWLERRARFDVVSLIWPQDARHPTVRHYENAFEASGDGQMYS